MNISKRSRTISANARVPIAKKSPRMRKVGQASRNPAAPAAAAPHARPGQNPQPHIAVAMPAAYAPIAKNACWPKEISPVRSRM